MDKARVDGTERQRQRVTVHWSDPEYYQLYLPRITIDYLMPNLRALHNSFRNTLVLS